MPSVGTAYVNVRVNTKGFEAGLDKMLARLSKKMESGGKKLGDDFVKGLESSNTEKFFRSLELRAQTASTKMSNDLKKVERSLDDVGLTASDAGDMLNSSFADAGPTLKNTRNDLRDISTAANDVQRSGRRASGSLNGIGRGNGFRSAATDAGFFGNILNDLSREGVSARKWLAGLHDTLAFTGTAVTVAVSGLSAAAQGIFALGAQAASTAPALGVLAGGLIGIGQVGGVVAIAMHGVGAAISAGFKSVSPAAATAAKSTKSAGTAAASAARAVAAAMRTLRDARQGLQRAYQDAGRAAEDAARRTSRAEQALASAQRDSTAAQKALNAARKEGLEQMEDIAFAAEDAGLAEDRAALALQDAQAQLVATSELAPDDRARVEAELAFKEADLNMREAVDRREDADKAQRESAKKGVQGTEAMVQAHQDVADAHEAEASAGSDLADARREEAQTAVDNAQKISDAQQAVKDALQGVKDAQDRQNKALKDAKPAATAAAKAVDLYKEALKKLSPEQRAFVERVVELGPLFKKARNQIAAPLFKGMLSGLNTVVASPSWGLFVDQLTGTSAVLGDLVDKAATNATKPPFSTALFDTMGNNNKVLANFGDAAGNLAGAFVQVADAAGPTLLKFSKWVKVVTASWNQTAIFKNKTGELDGTISRAGKRVAEFKDLFVALWGWLKKVGGAAFEASNNFKWIDKKGNKKTGYIPMLTEHLKEFTKTIDKKKNVDRFTTALENLSAAGTALKTAIIDPLISLGGDKRVGDSFNIISENKDTFQSLADTAGEAGPKLATLVTNVLALFDTLSKSGSMAVFLDQVGKFVGLISDLVALVPVPVLKAIGFALGTIAAVRFIGGIGKKLIAALVPPGLNKIPGQIRGLAPKIASAGGAVKTAGGDIAAGFELSLTTGFKEVGIQGYRSAKSAFLSVKRGISKSEGFKAGQELIAGVSLGIEAALEGALTASASAGKSIIGAMKKAMGVKSPSTLTAQSGRDLMSGLTLGIEEGEAGAVAAGTAAGKAAAAGVAKGAASGTGAVSAAGAGAAGAAGAAPITAVGGAAGGQVGKIGKFAGVFGKFSKVLGPATKLLKPLSLGLRVLGGAFRFMLGPVGMIALTLLPLLWPLLVKLEEKTGIFSKTLDVLKKALSKVVDAFSWLWDKTKEGFDWVKRNWPTLLAILTGPIGLAVLFITKNWDKITAAFSTVIDWITTHWKLILGILTGPIGMAIYLINKNWKKITKAAQTVITWVRTHWRKILAILTSPFTLAIKAIRSVFNFFLRGFLKLLPRRVRNQLKTLWDVLTDKLNDVWRRVQHIWGNIVTWVKGRPAQFERNLKTIWNVLRDKLKDIFTWLKNYWKDHVLPWIQGLPRNVFSGLKNIFRGMAVGMYKAVDWVLGKINRYLLKPFNSVLKFFGAKSISVEIPTLPAVPDSFATGGQVHGPGGPTSDSVLARVSNGEFVMPTKAARNIGYQQMEYMRKHGELPGQGGAGATGQGGLGGLFSGLVDRVKDIGSAIKEGAKEGFQWVIGKFSDLVAGHFGDSGIGKVVLSILRGIGAGATKKGNAIDAAQLAAARAASSSGKGPGAVWQALRSVGFTEVQTAGIMGNIQSESGFNPFIVQNDGMSMNPRASGSGGYGLVQWSPGSKLIPYLRGKAPSIDTEVTALANQLRGRGPSPEGAAGRRIRAATTVADATLAFETGYERHKGSPQPNRITQAQHWYQKFRGFTGGAPSAVTGGAAYTGPAGSWIYTVPKRTHTYNWPGHNPSTALDLGVGTGTPVHAMTSGAVDYVSGSPYSNSSYGYWIVLKHRNGWKTLYAHMSKITKKSGRVSAGTLLGYSGSSGDVSGPHLHLEITKNPGNWQSASTHTRAVARGINWPYKWGHAWAKGGVIYPNSDGSGVMGLVAEAGRAERITPLDSEGFTPAERRMLEALEASLGTGGGGSDTIHVHPSERMNEAHLADLVARRMAWKRRRGVGRR